MRIPGRKIWRAFRELDEFSDEQCRRFVKRAWGGWAQRMLASVLVIGTFLATLLVVGWAMVWLYSELDIDNRKRYSDLQIAMMAVPIVVVVAAAAPLMALIARDLLLRALVWRVLNIGGVCTKCNYPLYGLPLSEAMMCSCPECGAESSVDPSLVELVRNDSGQTVAKRKRAEAEEAKYFWTARRLKLTARVLLVVFGVVFVLPIVLLLLNEAIVRIEAARARSYVTGVETLQRALGRPVVVVPLVETKRTSRDADFEGTILNLYQRAGAEVVARDQNYQSSLANESPVAWGFTPRKVVLPANATEEEKRNAEVISKHMAWRRAVLEAMEGAELAGAMRGMGAKEISPDAPIPIVETTDGFMVQPEMNWTMGYGGNVAIERMWLGAEAGDREKFEESLRAALATIREDAALPLLQRWRYALLRERTLYQTLRDCVQMQPEWVGRVGEIVASMPIRANMDRVLEVERLESRGRVLEYLKNPDMVRFNRFTPELVRTYGGGSALPPGRVGWVGENVAANDALIDDAKARFVAPPWNRPKATAAPTGLLFSPVMGAQVGWYLPLFDTVLAARAGLPVMLAIEEYRAKHGRPPAALSELDLAPEMMVDPLSGKPWGYIAEADPKVIQALNPTGGYLLYSLSLDGLDDYRAKADPTIFVTIGRGWRISDLDGRDLLINGREEP